MFVCEKCVKPDDHLQTFLKSYGNCEVCGETASCWDINIHWKSEPDRVTGRDGE